MTQMGVILGTAAYMAPEQARGKAVDKRADIWAFGYVLFEMLSGRPLFGGESVTDTLAAVVRADPDWSRLPAGTPPSVRRLLQRCLDKEPRQRLRDIGEARIALEGQGAGADIARGPKGPRSAAIALLSGVGGAAVAAAIFALLASRPSAGVTAPGADRVTRSTIVLPARTALAPPSATPFNYDRRSFALSADGAVIAFVSATETGTGIYLRRLADPGPAVVPGTDGGFDPFFSPDGEWLGFFTFDGVWKVSLKGGAPLALASAVNPVGGTWCDNNTIYFAANEGDFIRSVPASGSRAQAATLPVPPGVVGSAAYPECLPGSAGLLITGFEADRPDPLSADYAAVSLLSLPAGSPARLLVHRGYAARYAASGHIVFARGGSLLAVPFDLGRLQITGCEAAVLNGVRMNSVSLPSAQFSMSREGALVFVSGGDESLTDLVWVEHDGRSSPTAVKRGLFGALHVSPDGTRVVVEVPGSQDDVYVYDLRDGRGIRLTSDGKGAVRPVWHPDGRSVVLNPAGASLAVLAPLESQSMPRNLSVAGISSWSPAQVLAGRRDGSIWVGSLDRQSLITTTGQEWGAVVSPDSRYVAYTSFRTGTFQVFVQPVPATGEEWQISSDFGEEPVWARNGRELYFRRHNQWWSAPVAAGRPGPPRLLFQGPYFNAFGPSYDVAPDGRFLMAVSPDVAPVRELMLVQHWFAQLLAKMSS